MSEELGYITKAGLLQDHVERIYRISPRSGDQDTAYLSLPTGCFRLGFNMAKTGRPTDGGEITKYPEHLLRGSAAKPVMVKKLKAQEQYTVVFKPHGLSRFTKIPVQKLAHEQLDAADVFGRDVKEVGERLLESSSPAQSFKIIEDFLLERYVPADVRMVEQAAAQIRNGVYNVSETCRLINCEERTLRRHFKKYTGVSIKEQIRLVRLNQVWKELSDEPLKRSLDIALDNGFSDQAHFNNEFKKLTGLTPDQVRKTRIAKHYQFEVLAR